MPDEGAACALAELRATAMASACCRPEALAVLAFKPAPSATAVFRARNGARAVALKCFLFEEATRRRVKQELRMARWASGAELGAPVRGAQLKERHAVLTMDLAAGDLEDVLRLRNQVAYPVVCRAFHDAFALVSDARLAGKGLACVDLKPANMLVFARARSCAAGLAEAVKGAPARGIELEVRLGDFDPFFWKRTKPGEAALLNCFVLLANSIMLRTDYAIGPYLPPAARHMAAAIARRDPALLAVLGRHAALLRRGPFHYAALGAGRPSELQELLTTLEAALAEHALL